MKWSSVKSDLVFECLQFLWLIPLLGQTGGSFIKRKAFFPQSRRIPWVPGPQESSYNKNMTGRRSFSQSFTGITTIVQIDT